MGVAVQRRGHVSVPRSIVIVVVEPVVNVAVDAGRLRQQPGGVDGGEQPRRESQQSSGATTVQARHSALRVRASIEV
jgi:hypothetical protein